MPRAKQLAHLQTLVENLPEPVPRHDFDSTHHPFSVTPSNIGEQGDETSMIDHWLEILFGSHS